MKHFYIIKPVFLILILFTITFTSCKKDEMYKANIIVVNNSGTKIENLMIIRDSNVIKNFDELNIDEEQSFEIEWIGKHQQFLGSYEDSEIYLHLKYNIVTETFDRSNLKKDKFDPYITNNSKAKIIISNSYYEVIITK